MRIIHYHHPRAGFSLIELSIVTAILAVVSVLGLEMMASYVTSRAYGTAQNQITTLNTAFRDFYKSSGRLPCPAVITNPVTGASGGTEDCTASTSYTTNVFAGGVPYITMGLPVAATIDPYGGKIRYLVTKDLTTVGSTANQFDNAASIGRIEVRTGQLEQPCSSACEVTMDPFISSGAAYALVSSGIDQRGGYNRMGIPIKACIPSPSSLYDQKVDSANCAGATNPAITPSQTGNAIIYDNKFNNGTNEINYFDDIVIARPKGDLG
jgi:prepilin-type N-terminal cleavage/methylation domain-containing protein